MYTCDACGGIVKELGEMAVTSGGCVCAQNKAEESANSLQRLKAEIVKIADRLDSIFDGNGCISELCGIANELRKLSVMQ